MGKYRESFPKAYTAESIKAEARAEMTKPKRKLLRLPDTGRSRPVTSVGAKLKRFLGGK